MKIGRNEQAQGGFPRTYGVDASWRHFFNGFAMFCVALFLCMTALYLAGFMEHPIAPRDLVWMNFLLALIIVWVGSWINRRVVLCKDAIEVKGWFSSRKL
jgi:hypothetical protein